MVRRSFAILNSTTELCERKSTEALIELHQCTVIVYYAGLTKRNSYPLWIIFKYKFLTKSFTLLYQNEFCKTPQKRESVNLVFIINNSKQIQGISSNTVYILDSASRLSIYINLVRKFCSCWFIVWKEFVDDEIWETFPFLLRKRGRWEDIDCWHRESLTFACFVRRDRASKWTFMCGSSEILSSLLSHHLLI